MQNEESQPIVSSTGIKTLSDFFSMIVLDLIAVSRFNAESSVDIGDDTNRLPSACKHNGI